jgi:hypothetical protein
MASILVVNETQDHIQLDGHVRPVDVEYEQALLQIERLGWTLGSAINEAQLLHNGGSRGRGRVGARDGLQAHGVGHPLRASV